jgi:hypothetical protein
MTDSPTNGFTNDMKWFMLVGVNLPTPGCWEITGSVKDQQLTYVVWVAP